MSRKLHRDGEKIKRIAAPHTAAAGLVPFGALLRTALTRATLSEAAAQAQQDCPHGFMRQTGGHPNDCPVRPCDGV